MEVLETFLQKNVFALGAPNRFFWAPGGPTLMNASIAVTDPERKFVLGVATQQDLEVRLQILLPPTLAYTLQNFVSRRGNNAF